MEVLNINDYGALGDGQTVCTKEIQKAIDLCPKGGVVCIPAGTFVSGALFLKSNMTLRLERGAKLLGSGHLPDFPLMGYPYEGLDQLCYASLLCTDGAPHENIKIEGEGVIDANGVALFHQEMKENRGKRGRAVCIRNTRNVELRGITIRQSPAWCLHLIYCSQVLIDSVEIQSKYDEDGNAYGIYNCDGMDIDSCQDVMIRNCMISSQDDGIAIKSGRNEEGRRVGIPSENVIIENCKFLSGFGVAIGSEMSGGVKDVYVRNCSYENTYSVASIKAIRGRGAYIKNIHFENCSMVYHSTEHKDCQWFRGGIYVDGFYGQVEFDPDEAQEIDEGTPLVDGLYFKNILVDTVGGYGIYLCGLPERPFKNIYMENVRARGKFGMYERNVENLQTIHTYIVSDEESGYEAK